MTKSALGRHIIVVISGFDVTAVVVLGHEYG